MAVSIHTTGGGVAFQKTGTGYWCTFNPDDITNPIDEVGYLQAGSIYKPFPFIELDPDSSGTAAQQGDYGLLVAFSNHSLGAFLYKLYQAGIDISNDGESLDLHSEIVAAGSELDYAGVNPLDFMFLTGAKILPGGLAVYLPNPLNPSYVPPERPNLWEVEDGPKEARDNMFVIIKYLGIWGLLEYLLVVKGGISWDEFIKCIYTWLPLKSDRDAYFPHFRQFLINKQQPKLTQKQIQQFLIEDQ